MEAKLTLTEVAFQSDDKLAAKNLSQHGNGKKEARMRWNPADTGHAKRLEQRGFVQARFWLITKRDGSKTQAPSTVTQHLAALRFFYIKTLRKPWSIAETPYPKKVQRLPIILSPEEVTQLINSALTPFHRILLMTLYRPAVGYPQENPSPYLEALLRNSSAGGGRRSAHHSDTARPP
jgi:hypothetical protein